MQYAISKQNVQSISGVNVYSQHHENLLTRFLNWCANQESNRFFWLGVTFFGQIGLTLPLTAWAIIFLGGNSDLLWIILCAINLPTLILNLAALPTKITLPFLFLAWITEALIVLYCVGFAMMH